MNDRVEGYWKIVKKETDEYKTWWHECNVCNGRPLYNSSRYQVLSRFCPWCGAYMDIEQEEMVDEEWMLY